LQIIENYRKLSGKVFPDVREKRNLKSFEPTLNKSHDLWFKLISPRLVTTTSSTSTANDSYHNDHNYRNSNGGGGSINSNGSNGSNSSISRVLATWARDAIHLKRQVCFFLLFCFVLLL
jgi:hypothetical protein